MARSYDHLSRDELIALLESQQSAPPTAASAELASSSTPSLAARQTKLTVVITFAIGAWLIMLAYLITEVNAPNWLIFVSTPCFSLLAILYWRKWEPAPYIMVVLFTIVVGLIMPEPYVTEQVSVAILLAPVLALVLITPRWMVVMAITSLLMILFRANWQGPYANPTFLAIYATLIGELLIFRSVLDQSNTQLEGLNRTLEQRIVERTNALQQALSDLQISERHLRTVVTNVPIILFSLDQDGTYTLAEGRGLSVLGIDPHRVIGHSLFQIYAHQQAIVADVKRALAGENVHVIRNVQEHVFETWYTALREPDGTITGTTGVSIDITARQRAEAELRIFRNAVDTSVTAIAIADLEGTITYINLAFLQLWDNTHDQTIGQSVLLRWQTPAEAAAVIAAVIRDGSWRGELTMLHRHGSTRTLQVHANIVADEAGLPIRIMANFIDITERTRAEEELRRSSEQLAQANLQLARSARLKDEFLANMSHELRTPLTSILGRSELLQEDVLGMLTEHQRRSVRSIEENGRHLLELINDILDLSKIEAGKMTLEKQPVRVVGLGQSCLRMIAETVLKKRLHIRTAFDENVAIIHADPRRLKQILVNLLANAVKFTPNGGEVGLEVRGNPTAQTVDLIVWDTGIGIAPDDQRRLFQPFIQIDSSLSRQYEGTGLGLVLVAQLAALHCGSVSLASVPGFGSRFTVTLPWEPTNMPDSIDPQPPVEVHPTVPIMASIAPLVLLVDDNAEVLLLLSEYLHLHGYRVDQAHTGSEALVRAQTEPPACIIMDIQLPEMNGLTVIPMLRTHSITTPILVLSAHAMPGDHEQALAAGANAYLSKPVRMMELLTTIAALIHAHGSGL